MEIFINLFSDLATLFKLKTDMFIVAFLSLIIILILKIVIKDENQKEK